MTKYKAILFDLFDTLVDLNPHRFPLVNVGGKERRTTGGVVYQALCAYYNHIAFEEFFQTFLALAREIDAIRSETHREILSHERFSRLLQRLGITSPPAAVVERLVTVHMDEMFAAMEFPSNRRRVLDQLKPAYRLGLVSNFDHPPTVHRVLEHYHLTPYFDAIVISGEVGWRKPRKEIFEVALSLLGITPWESLHVGDTPDADILGAQATGMHVAWFDRRGAALDSNIPPPDYTIRELEELPLILAPD